MFEREIKFIYDFNLNKVNRLGPYFTFEQLISTDIHPAILHYISAEIDYMIFEDRQKLLKNSLFDYSGEKITHYFSQISDEVKKSKRFSLEYISKLILHSSSFTINYLSRPKWTLLKFVFDDSNHKATTEIKQILNYVYYYQYLRKILISYINSKKIISMNSTEFSELLDKVDNLGMENYLNSIITNTIKSMSEFFNIGELQKNKIPLTAVELFLEEKKLNKHLHKLESIYGDDKNQKVNVTDLQKAFDGIMIEKSEVLTDLVTETEEFKEPIEPIESPEPESGEEPVTLADELAIEDTDELISYVESYKEGDKLLSGKLRIKIDKENEIEPIEEEVYEETNLVKEVENEILDKSSNSFYNEETEEDLQNEDESLEDESEILNKDIISDIDNQTKTEESIDNLHNEEEKLDEREIDDEENESMLDVILKSNQEDDQKDIVEENYQIKLSEEKIEDDEQEENILEKDESVKVELTDLLEHKDMTKIIEVIFDYDIEEFANVIDEISNCKFIDDAHVVLNQTFRNHNISRNSKEATAFREIISEYFKRK